MSAGGYFGRALVVDVSDGGASHAAAAQPSAARLPRRRGPRHLAAPPASPARRGPARPAGAARVRVLAARRHAAHHQREVRRSCQVAADRAAHRRARFQPVRHRRQAHRPRCDRRHAAAPPTPSVLLVDGDGARLEPATGLAGLSAAEAEASLKERYGRGWRVAAIGPAGEIGVRYATICHDGRHAGRGGLGAVMGAKNLKAILVSAATKVAVGRPGRRSSPPPATCASAAFGPATAEVPGARHPGEPPRLQRGVARCRPATSTAATFEGAPQLGRRGAGRACARSTARDAARAALPARSAASTSTPEGRRYATQVEYENVFALGPLCGVSDPDDVIAASARCDELGIDTISAGGTIAWAMECAERGLIDAPWLRFGDAQRRSSARSTRSAGASRPR